MTQYTIRAGTQLLQQQHQRKRQDHYADWIAQLGTQQCPAIQTTLYPLWRTKINNHWKEPFWDICLKGQLLAEMQPQTTPNPCGCNSSGPNPGRRHHYLECPVATHIYDTINQQLNMPDIPYRIWTVTPPPAFPKAIWTYICIAAAVAMNNGRKYLYAQTHYANPIQAPHSSLGQQAAHQAIDDFRSLLENNTTHMPQGLPQHTTLAILRWNTAASRWQLHL